MLEFLVSHINAAGISIQPPIPIVDDQYLGFDLNTLPDILNTLTLEVEETSGNFKTLLRQEMELKEYRMVVDVTDRLLNSRALDGRMGEPGRLSEDVSSIEMYDASKAVFSPSQSEVINEALLGPNDSRREIHVDYSRDSEVEGPRIIGMVCGTVVSARRIALDRMLFRATRGNVLAEYIELTEPTPDPLTGDYQQKCVCVLFYQGAVIGERIAKICGAFGVNVYDVPDGTHKRHQLIQQLSVSISQQTDILERTRMMRNVVLEQAADNIGVWKLFLLMEKASYSQLNHFKCDRNQSSLIGEGWCRAHLVEDLQDTFQMTFGDESTTPAPIISTLPILPKHSGPPPTHFETDEFTSVFQLIVDSYGIAGYREINPAIFTIATFPFLFAVMFGDVGHGACMVLMALYLFYVKRKDAQAKLSEIMNGLMGARYLFLLMGVFAVYCGFIYNETFAVPYPWFSSTKWSNVTDDAYTAVQSGVYPFGIDPTWHESATGLAYLNSLKMKMAIIFGVSQMMLGIVLSAYNAVYFRRYIDIATGFIPQIIFLTVMFGNLCAMILIKWSIDWAGTRGTVTPPSLLQQMINIFLSGGNTDPATQLYHNQHVVEAAVRTIAILCIPWMLLVKPLYLWLEHNGYFNRSGHIPVRGESLGSHEMESPRIPNAAEPSIDSPIPNPSHESFDFGEICIGSLIHTLEFVLGTVSNTASYLRLWALSLAHGRKCSFILHNLTHI